MEYEKRIYCIEGVHNWGESNVEPTVEPMLELLQKLGYWKYYTLITCATLQELEYRLKIDWYKCCTKGSVLYFNTHGSPGSITLVHEEDREFEQVIGVDTLKEWVNLAGCHVHFGGCFTFGDDQASLEKFLDHTEAASVSGYAVDEIGWLDWKKPGLALELLFFGLLSFVKIDSKGQRRLDKLTKIKEIMNDRFSDCAFQMLY